MCNKCIYLCNCKTFCYSAAVSNQSKSSRSSSYAALTLLLKSVLCISRITPGYKFSKNQKKESYCMEYEFVFVYLC